MENEIVVAVEVLKIVVGCFVHFVCGGHFPSPVLCAFVLLLWIDELKRFFFFFQQRNGYCRFIGWQHLAGLDGDNACHPILAMALAVATHRIR